MLDTFLIKLIDVLRDSIWLGGIFWLFLWISLRVISPKFAKTRYYISILVFFVLLLVLISVSLTYNSIYEMWLRPKVMVMTNSGSIKLPVYKFNFFDHIKLFIIDNTRYICVLWLLGFVVYISKLLYQFKKVHTIVVSGISDYGLQLLTKELVRKLDIKRDVVVKFMSNGSHPFTIGYFKPIVYFPIQAVTGFSEQEIELILFHELIHIKRGDYFINVIQLWVETIFFFNPFIRHISTMIRNEREASCDYMVVNYGYPKSVYAKALERSYEMHYNLALSFGDQNVFSRIKNLKKFNPSNQKNRWSTKCINAFITSVFVLFTVGFGVSTKNNLSDVQIISRKKTALYPRMESKNDTIIFKIDEHRALYQYKDSLVAYTVDGMNMESELLNFEKRKEDKGEYIEFSIVHKISGEIIEQRQKIKESDWKTFMRSLRDQCLMKYEGSMIYITPFGDMYIDDNKLPETIQKKNESLIRKEIPFNQEAIAFAKEMIAELQKDKLVVTDFDKVKVVFQPKEDGTLLLNDIPLSKKYADKYFIFLKKIRGEKLYDDMKYIIK